MNFTLKQLNSLAKVRSADDMNIPEIYGARVAKGMSFSYQLAFFTNQQISCSFSVNSRLSDYINMYIVKDAVMDCPMPEEPDDDYITFEPGLMPDILVPAKEQNNTLRFFRTAGVWVELNIPEDMASGSYEIEFTVTAADNPDMNNAETFTKKLNLEVCEAVLPPQKLLFTQWFHVDCIADWYGLDIYSEKHWEYIEKFAALASELGMNMILTPVITPPLDTAVGTRRPCTQLVRIEKNGDKYSFDFSLLSRWTDMCRRLKIEYFEISHLFSQWGANFAPNILISENGEDKFLFGWDVPSDDDRYKDFLSQFLPALSRHLKDAGVFERCYFHISDEPTEQHIESYSAATRIAKELLPDAKFMDALSDYTFYEKGLVETPVCANDHIGKFLEHNVENLWTYYCCLQTVKVGNRLLAMPAYRNRILGLQMYKFGIKGFLQWGYNFYYGKTSYYKINPFTTTSAECSFPSGDPFSVYPYPFGPVPSMRAKIFKEALDDMRVCRALEQKIGRDAVIKMIDEEAGFSITFGDYPRNAEFVPALIGKMLKIIG